jgi:hypothetical protein
MILAYLVFDGASLRLMFWIEVFEFWPVLDWWLAWFLVL